MLENLTSELICRMESETMDLPLEAKDRVVHLFRDCEKRYLFSIRCVICVWDEL